MQLTLTHSHTYKHAVPGPVTNLKAVPSFFKVLYTWQEPLNPNGIITTYQMNFTTTDSSTDSILCPQTSFLAPTRYEMGAEVNLTVVAFTAVGAGQPTTLTVSTLSRPRECLCSDTLTSLNVQLHTSFFSCLV